MSGQPTVHALKTWPEFFEAVASGRKTYEIRKDDRAFRVGDTLRLDEWDPTTRTATGRMFLVEIVYMTRGEWGLPPDLCVLGIDRRSGVPYYEPRPKKIVDYVPTPEPVRPREEERYTAPVVDPVQSSLDLSSIFSSFDSGPSSDSGGGFSGGGGEGGGGGSSDAF